MLGWPLWIWWTIASLASAAGAALFIRALFQDRSRGRKRCPRCWYDLSATGPGDQGWTCPECGRVTSRERSLHRTRRRWRLAALGLILTLALPGVWIPIYINRPGHGWWSLTPTPILMWVLGRQTNPTGPANGLALQELMNSRLHNYWHPGPIHYLLEHQAASRLTLENSVSQRMFGIWALDNLAARGRGLDAIVGAAASDPDQDIREAALHYLGQVRARVDVVLPVASAAIGSPDSSPECRIATFALLGNYSSDLSQADANDLRSTALRVAMADPNEVGAAATSLLGQLQPLPDSTIGQLTTLLESTKADHARWYDLEETLGKCGPRAERAAAIIIDRLDKGRSGNYITAVLALGRMGTTAKAGAEVLAKVARKDPMPDEAFQAECARRVVLGEYPALLDSYAALLTDPDSIVRTQALSAMGPFHGRELIPFRDRIKFCLNDPDPGVRYAALEGMLWLEEAAAPDLPTIRSMARKDPDPKVREAATNVAQLIDRAACLAK